MPSGHFSSILQNLLQVDDTKPSRLLYLSALLCPISIFAIHCLSWWLMLGSALQANPEVSIYLMPSWFSCRIALPHHILIREGKLNACLLACSTVQFLKQREHPWELWQWGTSSQICQKSRMDMLPQRCSIQVVTLTLMLCWLASTLKEEHACQVAFLMAEVAALGLVLIYVT